MSKVKALEEIERELSIIEGNPHLAIGKDDVNRLLGAIGSDIRFDEMAHLVTVNYTVTLETLRALGRDEGFLDGAEAMAKASRQKREKEHAPICSGGIVRDKD